jgi:hypothetical protein
MNFVARAGQLWSSAKAFFGSARGLSRAAIVLGIILRLADYANNRDLWLDEKYLGENVIGRPIFELDRQLTHDQLAPPGFLVVARVSSRVLGASPHALRFLPLVCGIASLFVLDAVARRSIAARAVPLVLALAAVSDDLIYYSTEFKQYMSDLLVALGCLLLAWDLEERELTPRRLATSAGLGVAATWFSLPSVFMLAGTGLWLAVRAAWERRWRRLAALAVLGGAWGSSFAACFVVSSRLLGESRFMWTWWDFAFLPLPPRSLADVEQVFWQFVNVFSNPVGIVSPLGPPGTALLALALFFLGCLSLAAKRRWGVLVTLTAPIVLALIASALHRYPFHGRQLLFLVPSFLLPLGEGADLVGRRLGRIAMAVVVVLLLITTTIQSLDQIDRPRSRTFDSHGDQRNDLLDYFEIQAHVRALRRR